MRANPAGLLTARCLHRSASVALFWVACGIAHAASAPNELGHPVVRDFPPGRSAIAPHSPTVTQDAAGFIYLANGAGVRCYDGATWHWIPLPTESAGIRKFAVTADGTVFLGGAGVIGYLRGAGKAAEFVSLADRLPSADRNYDDFFDVLAAGDTVYFADEEKILIWRDGHFTLVPCRTPPHSRGARLHRVGDTVYVTALERGLSRLVDDQLEAVADDAVLRENQIVSVEAGAAGALVLLTAERGFFQLVSGRVSVLPTEANRWLAGKVIFRARRLADGSRVVAFTSVSGDGGMRFGADGGYLGPIDQSTGLYVKTLRDFFSDREGGLWIGSETGVFRLEWPSGVTVFDAVNGLGSGAVADFVRHAGTLYAATSEGVFRLAPGDEAGRCARFERVASQPAYALVSHPGGLLALGYADLFVQSSGGFVSVAKLPPGGGSLHRSARDPDRVWMATTDGVRTVRHTTEGWRDEGRWDGGKDSVRSVTEAAECPAAAGAGESAALWRARPDAIERVPRDGGLSRALPRLVAVAAGAVGRLREEPSPEGAVLWLGGARGLVRVEVARAFPAPVPFATLLGAKAIEPGARLAPDHAALTFDFLALRFQLAESLTYQTRLAGQDRAWSDWSRATSRTFTRLAAGDYRFEVRARDADGQISPVAGRAFAVRSPWWLTGWAMLGYAAVSAGAFTGLVRRRTRSLHRRAESLEALVTVRTAELARQNAELIRLNHLELDEKITARLAEEKARLEVLRYQLNPHFLFNTLASISASLPAGSSTARAMVERLADFCRLTLHRADERDWTTLGGEMQLLRAYLEIEQSRWGDLLTVELACDPALLDEPLPHFLLLPLVENALKYGRATSPDRVGLRLAAGRGDDGALVLEVANTGEWVEPAAKRTVSSLGIGLDNLRERLHHHYPRAHGLTIAHAAGWVTVTLRLPPAPAA